MSQNSHLQEVWFNNLYMTVSNKTIPMRVLLGTEKKNDSASFIVAIVILGSSGFLLLFQMIAFCNKQKHR